MEFGVWGLGRVRVYSRVVGFTGLGFRVVEGWGCTLAQKLRWSSARKSMKRTVLLKGWVVLQAHPKPSSP